MLATAIIANKIALITYFITLLSLSQGTTSNGNAS
jgi:hypothetical protein